MGTDAHLRRAIGGIVGAGLILNGMPQEGAANC
jgi:hypothetical protein